MKRFFASTILLSFLLLAVGCSRENVEAKSTEQIHRENGIPVKVEKIEPETVSESYEYYAVLSGSEESVASAALADRVESVLKRVGDTVQKNEVVVTFPKDNPSAQYYQAKIGLDHAGTTLARIQKLYDSGGISRQELDNTRTQFEIAQANFDAVTQAVDVRAPISGRISQLKVRETDNVSPGDVLFKVSNINKLKAQIWVTEEQAFRLAVGDKAKASWHGQTLAGKVTQIDLALDRDMQAFGVIAEFSNPGNKLNSGINALVNLIPKNGHKSIVIERKHIVYDGDTPHVYVKENNLAVFRKVTTGRSLDTSVEILAGLDPGETLITSTQHLLTDGAKVLVVEQ